MAIRAIVLVCHQAIFFRWRWRCFLTGWYTSQIFDHGTVTKRHFVQNGTENTLVKIAYMSLRLIIFLDIGLLSWKICNFEKIWHLTSHNWIKYCHGIKTHHQSRVLVNNNPLFPRYALRRLEKKAAGCTPRVLAIGGAFFILGQYFMFDPVLRDQRSNFREINDFQLNIKILKKT